MQLPDVVGSRTATATVSQFLDSFLRGNRDDQPRKTEGSILQALNLMNNNLVVNSGRTLTGDQRQPVDRAEHSPRATRTWSTRCS